MIHNAVLLAEENRQLQAANKRQKKKRARRREYIATRGVLIVQEGLNRSQIDRMEPEDRIIHQTEIVQTRALRMYSVYRSLEHTACTCPQKQVSN